MRAPVLPQDACLASSPTVFVHGEDPAPRLWVRKAGRGGFEPRCLAGCVFVGSGLPSPLP